MGKIRQSRFYCRLFRKLPYLISRAMVGAESVLDVGCGRNSVLRRVVTKDAVYKVGIDIYEPYVNQAIESGVYDEVLLGDARRLPFGAKSFDCVVAVEVLEHLHKEDGLIMIEEMERVARRKIIMSTPNGFLDLYAGPKDNPDEKHLYGCTVSELKELGFRVYGMNGLKVLWEIKQGQAVPRIKPSILGSLLIDITELYTYHVPASAFQLFFVKTPVP